MLCGLLPAILKVSKIYQSLTENGLFLTNPVCGVTKSFKFGLFMSCKEGKDSLLLKLKGTLPLFSIYLLELKKELLRTPQYHVIHQKFFHWIWYLNLVWWVPYAKFWVQAKKHIKIHVFYNTGNFSQLIVIRSCSQITSSYFGGFWTIYIVNHATIIFWLTIYVLILDDVISEWHLTQNSIFKHTYLLKRKYEFKTHSF